MPTKPGKSLAEAVAASRAQLDAARKISEELANARDQSAQPQTGASNP